jgi:UDP-N-acetylmuramoyl-tripeptide--D-alanyl-D-alanine ligase
MNELEIKRGLENLEPPEHRLSPRYFKNTDILIIDDAFNGNPDGALAAMKTLSHFQKQRRIYLTPGLVELGNKSQAIHESLGKNLAFHTDEVWLIQTSATDFIRTGLQKSHFPEERIRIFPTAVEAHTACKSLPSGTVLLMQNDWTDNYQ